MLRRFASSSIEFDAYYWHASDVPAELAARHDVMLAIHQAFADEGITIAFPQVVVWQGTNTDDSPYGPAPVGGEVFTEHAAVTAGREPTAGLSSGSWLPWRR